MSARTRLERMVKSAAQEVCSHRPFNRLITWRGRRSRPHVALTFDDGPDPEYTPRVLDILDDHGVVATFFVLGRQVAAHPDLMERIITSGHEIGIHGYDHTLDDLPGQTVRTQKLLAGMDTASDLFRPPGGNLLPATELWMIRNGLRTVLWSYDLHDSMRNEGKIKIRQPLSDIGTGDVILMHDDNPVCTGELPEILALLDQRRLTPVTVSQLLSH